jgi:hypothetical protein
MDQLLPYLDMLTEYWWILGVVIAVIAIIASNLSSSGSSARKRERAVGSAASSAAAGPREERLSDLPEAAVQARVQAFFERVGHQVGEGKIVVKKNDDDVEWRGQYQSVPIRIRHDTFGDIEMEAKVNNPHGLLSLGWDPAKVEETATNDAWSDEDDICVLVGKAVFVEGTPDEVDEELAHFRCFPQEAVQAVMARMGEHEIGYWHVGESRVALGFTPKLDDLADAEERVSQAAQLLGWFVQVLEGTPVDPASPAAHQGAEDAPPAPTVKTATCAYCKVRYLWTGDYRCPNCGAPVQAS